MMEILMAHYNKDKHLPGIDEFGFDSISENPSFLIKKK